MGQIAWLDSDSLAFPPVRDALEQPNGLLAAGGDLRPERLLVAYRSGIFPWFEDGQPLLWWSPSPRCVLRPTRLNVSRSLKKRLRRNEFEVRLSTDFEGVVRGCRAPRQDESGTWITEDMVSAYVDLHRMGFAQSVETWVDGQLVGGLYGVTLGKLFFGESMFFRRADASKVAFAWLCRLMIEHDGPLIDCQIENDHLLSLGAEAMPGPEFQQVLERYATTPMIPWQQMHGPLGPW